MKKNIIKLSLLYLLTFLFCSKIYSNENLLVMNEYRKAYKNSFLLVDSSYTKGYKSTDRFSKTDGARSHFFSKFFHRRNC